MEKTSSLVISFIRSLLLLVTGRSRPKSFEEMKVFFLARASDPDLFFTDRKVTDAFNSWLHFAISEAQIINYQETPESSLHPRSGLKAAILRG